MPRTPYQCNRNVPGTRYWQKYADRTETGPYTNTVKMCIRDRSMRCVFSLWSSTNPSATFSSAEDERAVFMKMSDNRDSLCIKRVFFQYFQPQDMPKFVFFRDTSGKIELLRVCCYNKRIKQEIGGKDMLKRWLIPKTDAARIDLLSRDCGLSRLSAQVLACLLYTSCQAILLFCARPRYP